MTKADSEFNMERKLRHLNPDLHRRFTNSVFAMMNVLSKYQLIFPGYTDHTVLHSMSVVQFCNQLIGERINQLNEDEIYILLMSCYLHDTGMGISMKNYLQFSEQIDFGNYFETHSQDNIPDTIRNFHHEFSGQFIRKLQS